MAARNQTFSKHIPEPAPAAGARRPSGVGGDMAASAFAAGAGRTAASGGKARAAVLAAGAGRLAVAIGREAAANFRAWFGRNFADPRAGRIGGVPYSRAGALDDRPGDWAWYSDAYGRAFYDHTEPLTPDEEGYILSHPLVMLQLALGVTDLRGLRCLRRGLTLRTNALQQKAYRSRYYARDNARRRALAAERRKIRRRATANPCPTPDGFREAFAAAKGSAEAKVRFGGMVHDLACYVDSCLRYDGAGNIVGRNGGVRAWLAENVPELSPRYKTIMRYKALAVRVRQLAGIADPVPTSALLDGADAAGAERADAGETGAGGETGRTGGAGRVENYYAVDSHSRGDGMRGPRTESAARAAAAQVESMPHGLERKRRLVRRLLAECRNSFRDVFGRFDSALGQEGLGNAPDGGWTTKE